MSIKEHAEDEMRRAGFPADEIVAMRQILDIFFENWDSGGAVYVMAPVLQRCIAGKPLTALTGEDDEWYKPMDDVDVWQNVRCGTVFKENGRAYDINTPGRPQITFPYWPVETAVSDPVIEVETDAFDPSPKL